MAMFLAITAALFVSVLMVMVRIFGGPTLYDRILAVNSFGTLTVLILSALGFVTGRPDFLDIAMLYALINFIGTIAILKFFRYRSFGAPREPEEES
jgi:multicomponent Na+:H+ antiporter subunit F